MTGGKGLHPACRRQKAKVWNAAYNGRRHDSRRTLPAAIACTNKRKKPEMGRAFHCCFATSDRLFFLGSLMNSYIRRELKSGINLKTGWSLSAALSTLVLTGYGLYYLTGEADRTVWSMVHWMLGLALPVVLSLHIARGRVIRHRSHYSVSK